MPAAYGDESTLRDRRWRRTRAAPAASEVRPLVIRGTGNEPKVGAFDSNAPGLEDVAGRAASSPDVSIRTPR
jgi:hypothetical protein